MYGWLNGEFVMVVDCEVDRGGEREAKREDRRRPLFFTIKVYKMVSPGLKIKSRYVCGLLFLFQSFGVILRDLVR